MTDTAASAHRAPSRVQNRILGWIGALLGFVLLLVLVVMFFPWDVLRGPLNRYVSDQTGRRFEITRHLDVKLGRTTRILADGIEFANPQWAHDPYLLKAESAEFDVKFWPLLFGRVELPLVSLSKPQLGMQMEADGRRTWALGRDTSDTTTVPQIESLVVDDGTVHFLAAGYGADIRTEFAIDPSNPLPLSYNARGTWMKDPFVAQGRTGSVLKLTAPLAQPFPVRINATAGRTTVKGSGTIASLATVDGADVAFELHGENLADLYKLAGVVLPETPPYAVRGRLAKEANVWKATAIQGKLGNSDIEGNLDYDISNKVPLLSGKLRSRELDFNDLAPLVGLPAQGSSTKTVTAALSGGGTATVAVSQKQRPVPPKAPATAVAQASAAAPAASPNPNARVLPVATLDLARLKAMNADVWFDAPVIKNVRMLPLDRMKTHVVLNDGVLQLGPLDLGVAGGTLAGNLRIDSHSNPAVVAAKMDARQLQLARLFPTIERTKSSFGNANGLIDLQGRGNSVAQMLASSNGNVAMAMGRGEMSNMLLEIVGLDGGEILKFLLKGDRNVVMRCAGAAFDVKQGLMTSRALVLDTTDTVVYGSGTVSLADESLDLRFKPQPKDHSLLSFRSPLKIAGTFAAPSAGPDKGALAGKAGMVLALGAINPLLGLAATFETGPGKDTDCGQLFAQVGSPAVAAKSGGTTVAKAPVPTPTPAAN